MSVAQSGSTGNEVPTPDQSKASEWLENIPEDLRGRLAQFIGQNYPSEHNASLLPPPNLFAKYEPDVQRIIFDAAVENRKHQAALEARGQRIEFYRRVLGLLFGFVLALIMIIGSLHIILSGQSTVGLIGLGVTLAASATAFVYTDLQRRSDSVTARKPSANVDIPEQTTVSGKHEQRVDEGNNV